MIIYILCLVDDVYFTENCKISTEFINPFMSHILTFSVFGVSFFTLLHFPHTNVFTYLFYWIPYFLPCAKSFLHLFHYFYWYLIHLRNLFYIKIGLNIDLLLSGLNVCPIIWYRRVKLHVFWLVLNAILIVSSTLDTVTFHLYLNFLLYSIHLSTLAHLHCILVFEAT